MIQKTRRSIGIVDMKMSKSTGEIHWMILMISIFSSSIFESHSDTPFSGTKSFEILETRQFKVSSICSRLRQKNNKVTCIIVKGYGRHK